MALDLRLIRVGIEVDGRINWYASLMDGKTAMKIRVSGTKYANPLQNDCTVVITNLSHTTRDYIITQASPYNKSPTPKRLIVEVGRVSTGVMQLFIGDIISAEPSQPPDIALTIKALTQNAAAQVLSARSGGPATKLSVLSKSVADDLGLALDFQADEKNVANYQHSGAALKQVEKLQTAGGVSAYIDDGVLVVKNARLPLNGRARILSKTTGMIGIPKPDEKGLKVSMFIDADTVLGGGLILRSQINKAANGDYVITQLGFDAESHGPSFYYHALALRI